MPDRILDKGTIAFQAEGRLLQELGLRLVASPEVALVELIKNAYDADSSVCHVQLLEGEEEDMLSVEDDGCGMTKSDFISKWMCIATSSKTSQEYSRKYRRKLTGAKGIGRFAVRYLGDHLTLRSVSYDKQYRTRTKLEAVFDWTKLDKIAELSKVKVRYTLVAVGKDEPVGTTLTIRQLRSDASFVSSKRLRDDVLRMVSPIQGLDRGKFTSSTGGKSVDPGFKVMLPGEDSSDDSIDLARLVLDNYWGRLTIKLTKSYLEYRVSFSEARKPRILRIPMSSSISNGLFADIRFFPRRKGVFSQKGVNGKKAWAWVRNNCGVSVVDHGFRIRPYGFLDDDWLSLDTDAAHNIRDWGTDIAKKYFQVHPTKRASPALNPVLNLASNFQLVGAVFIETKRTPHDGVEVDLIPAMDREGLLSNKGSKQLKEYVRAGVEFLAQEDKAELERLAAKQAKEAAITAREEIQLAIEHIQDSDTLISSDKSRIVKQYRALSDQVDKQEEYSAQSRRSLMAMSLLGVLAGFMTHESKAAVYDLEIAVKEVKRLARKHSSLKTASKDLSRRLANFQDYLEYSRMFTKGARTATDQRLSASAQVRVVTRQFESFANQRGIEVSNEIPRSIKTPVLPVTIYSGVLLNLFTNAMKSVISVQDSVHKPRILFRSWNERKKHILEVSDNGPGIPPDIRKRIWDPLYTTTSDIGNPLGSGMGLGLTLVKQVVTEYRGKISLAKHPPPEYTTCFRVEFSE